MVESTMPLPALIEVTVTEPLMGWYPVASGYVEQHWLPVVGPTAWALARRLALIGCAAGWGECVSHDTDQLARMLGVGVVTLWHSIGRLDRFGLAQWLRLGTPPHLSLRGSWPDLPRRHLDRFSDFLIVPH